MKNKLIDSIKKDLKLYIIGVACVATVFGGSLTLTNKTLKNQNSSNVNTATTKTTADDKKGDATTMDTQKTNTSQTVVQPQQTTQQPQQTTKTVQTTSNTQTNTQQTQTIPKETVYDFTHMDESKIIKNSSKYTVTLEKATAKVGDNIKLYVSSLDRFSAYITRCEGYDKCFTSGSNGDWLMQDGKYTQTYTDTIVVQNWDLINGNTIN